MPIIHEQTANSLYKQAERTASTFPSGLLRVDQKYICNTAAAATHRVSLAVGNSLPDDDDAPAIDGLFIFPHCQESRQAGGFTEFLASAYGRTTTEPSNFINSEIVVQAPAQPTFNAASTYKLRNFTCEIVGLTADGLSLDSLNLDPEATEPYDFFYRNSFCTVRNIAVEQYSRATINFTSAGKLAPFTYVVQEVFQVTYNNFTDAGVLDSPAVVTRSYSVLKPNIVITSQSNYGKFTEYKIAVTHNIETRQEPFSYNFQG